VFKIGTLVFQVVTLAKRQQESPLLEFCYGFNKTFEGFFFFLNDKKGAPSLKLTLDRLIHSTFSMLNIIARYHQFHWRCNAFFLA
jgi:hypothetical protein